MADSRFFVRRGPFRLRELAEITGAELSAGADPDIEIGDVAPLDAADRHQISFLDNRRYIEAFAKSRAGACLVMPRHADRAPEGMALLITSIVLVAGFLVLALSTFELNSGMGLLTAIVIALALFADFLFLPPLLIKFEEKSNDEMGTTDSATRVSTA